MALIDMNASLDCLIVGDSNSKAYAAIKEMVAQYPAPKILLLYGPSGSGKTALLRAATGEITKGYPEVRMLWQSSEEYIRLLITAIKASETEAFKRSYIGNDLLIIDNLEDFVGKPVTQTGLAENIAEAYNSGAQVFLAANHYCKPLKVEALLREMIPDFTAVVDLALPDQITLERAWINYGKSLGLPCSTDFIEFFHKSEVQNFWALNGLLQSYLTQGKLTFNETATAKDHKSYKKGGT